MATRVPEEAGFVAGNFRVVRREPNRSWSLTFGPTSLSINPGSPFNAEACEANIPEQQQRDHEIVRQRSHRARAE